MIIKMMKVTILEGQMEDIFWPELVPTIIHVKNLGPT